MIGSIDQVTPERLTVTSLWQVAAIPSPTVFHPILSFPSRYKLLILLVLLMIGKNMLK